MRDEWTHRCRPVGHAPGVADLHQRFLRVEIPRLAPRHYAVDSRALRNLEESDVFLCIEDIVLSIGIPQEFGLDAITGARPEDVIERSVGPDALGTNDVCVRGDRRLVVYPTGSGTPVAVAGEYIDNEDGIRPPVGDGL